MPFLPTEPRSVWVAALRSGQYDQHQGTIASPDLKAFWV